MERITEPELMDGEAQALAYAEADFSEPHDRFVSLCRESMPSDLSGYVLDLGCGPADVTIRFARVFRGCIVHGIDGSAAMLECGRRLLAKAPEVAQRITLIDGLLPGADLPRLRYDACISNSLLHHLHDPMVLWNEVKAVGAPGARVCVMDLTRPESTEEARRLVDLYAAGEPEVLRRDFFNSLLAAFQVSEVRDQLRRAGLEDCSVRQVSDRHLLVVGQI